jgi:AcrR family transcriptional regulator
MPRLWNDTIEAHRRDVHRAILDTTAELVAERGLRSVTMAQIAERTGIGRATLYKYFPEVETILVAWHDRHVTGHLQHLAEARDAATDPGARLRAVLTAYAHVVHEMSRRHHGTELSAVLHRDERVAAAQQQLHDLVVDVLAEAARAGDVRTDVAPDELATYCVSALGAAGNLPSTDAVGRLVALTLTALRPGTAGAVNSDGPTGASAETATGRS